jgi:hypothetical protein
MPFRPRWWLLGIRVVVGGWAQDARGEYAWAFRALDLVTGLVVWEDQVTGGGVNALTGVGSRVFAAGFLDKAGAVPDVTARAYEMSGQ